MVYFDGLDSALFSSPSKPAIYTHEILDYWLYEVAMLGNTLQATYEASKNLSRSPSIVQHRLGTDLLRNRRQASTVFGAFLCTLSYPKEENIAPIFNCTQCETEGASGGKTMRSIVMDSTATGILGDPPRFDRPSLYLEPAKNTVSAQFVLKGAAIRKYLDYFFCSAPDGANEGASSVRIPDTRTCDKLEKLVSLTAESNDATAAVSESELLRLSFNLQSLEHAISPMNRRRRARDATITVHHLLPENVIRTAYIDFMRSVL